MVEHFKAIVLKVVRHSEKTQIVDMLTDSYGRMAFAVPAPSASRRGVRSRTLWRPLNILEFESDLKAAKGMPRPKDVSLAYVYSVMTFDPLRSMIAMYVDELLCASIWGEVPDVALFEFVRRSLLLLDNPDCKFRLFHIAFALNLLQYIGIQPNMERVDNEPFFDLRAAEFVAIHPLHSDVLESREAADFQRLMRMNYRNMHLYRLNRNQIVRTLEVISQYYSLHLPNFKGVNATQFFHDALS